MATEKFYYCSAEIELENKCKTQCDYCKEYFADLEKKRREDDDAAEKNKTDEIRNNFH